MSRPEERVAAAAEGDADRVSRLLDQDPELVHSRNAQGLSLAMVAVDHSQAGIIPLLVEHRARLDVPAGSGA